MILLQKSIMERFNTLIDSEKPLLIGFSAQWCGPCKITIPILKKLEKRLEDKITIIELDIDFPPNRNIIHRYRIIGSYISSVSERLGKMEIFRHSDRKGTGNRYFLTYRLLIRLFHPLFFLFKKIGPRFRPIYQSSDIFPMGYKQCYRNDKSEDNQRTGFMKNKNQI